MGIEMKSKHARIERIRERLRQAREVNPDDPLVGVIAAILDLLKDEL